MICRRSRSLKRTQKFSRLRLSVSLVVFPFPRRHSAVQPPHAPRVACIVFSASCSPHTHPLRTAPGSGTVSDGVALPVWPLHFASRRVVLHSPPLTHFSCGASCPPYTLPYSRIQPGAETRGHRLHSRRSSVGDSPFACCRRGADGRLRRAPHLSSSHVCPPQRCATTQQRCVCPSCHSQPSSPIRRGAGFLGVQHRRAQRPRRPSH